MSAWRSCAWHRLLINTATTQAMPVRKIQSRVPAPSPAPSCQIRACGAAHNRLGRLQFHEEELFRVRHEAHAVAGAFPRDDIVTPVVADAPIGIIETRLLREDRIL